jgi:hypothetical protein
VNEAAFLQSVEKIRFKSGHLSATLIILISRYFQGIVEQLRIRLPLSGPLWHYKMCLWGTS